MVKNANPLTIRATFVVMGGVAFIGVGNGPLKSFKKAEKPTFSV